MHAIGLGLKICRIVARKRAKDVARDAGIGVWWLSCIENERVLPIAEVEARLSRMVEWKPAEALFLAQMAGAASETQSTPNHQAAMERRERDGQVWYSRRDLDGTWCKGV